MNNVFGRWIYNKDNATITTNVHPGYDYEIDLDTVKDHYKVIDWLLHMTSKNWVSKEDITDLLFTFDAVLGGLRNRTGGNAFKKEV